MDRILKNKFNKLKETLEEVESDYEACLEDKNYRDIEEARDEGYEQGFEHGQSQGEEKSFEHVTLIAFNLYRSIKDLQSEKDLDNWEQKDIESAIREAERFFKEEDINTHAYYNRMHF